MVLQKERLVKVRKLGNSLIMTLPAAVASAYSLMRGDLVIYQLLDNKGILISKFYGDEGTAVRRAQ